MYRDDLIQAVDGEVEEGTEEESLPEWYSAGLENGDFTISSVEQLNELAALVNNGNTFEGQNVTLGDDIIIAGSWTPIGAYAEKEASRKPFSGSFDGAGYTIQYGVEDATITYTPSGNYMGVGLFGYTDGAVIENLTLSGNFTVVAALRSNTGVGALAGYVNSTEIRAVTSEVKLTITMGVAQNRYLGGLVGYSDGSADAVSSLVDCKVTDGWLTVEKTVQQNANYQNIGGLVGYATYTDIYNSYNLADISHSPAGTYVYIGGVIGYGVAATIRNAANGGSITSTSTLSPRYYGGIAGYLTTGSMMENCCNFGDMPASYTGAVAGYNNASSVQYCYGAAGSGLSAICYVSSSASMDSLGTFTDPTGALTPSNGTALAYWKDTYEAGETALLYALNTWAAVNADKAGKYWIEEGNILLPVGDVPQAAEAVGVTIRMQAAEAEGEPLTDANGTASIGAYVVLTVDITTDGAVEPALSYQWYEGVLPLKSYMTEIPDADGSSYAFTAASAGTKYYYVVVKNTYGQNVVTTESNLFAVDVSSGEGEAWAGTPEAFSNGDGTEDNPWEITSAGQLMYLSRQTNAGVDYSGQYFKLMQDIDLNGENMVVWTPIGSADFPFVGYFDGNEKTIANLYATGWDGYTALFGYTSAEAVISNVTVTGRVQTTSGHSAGVVGYNQGTIKNVTSEVAVTVSAASAATTIYVGGIAAYQTGTISSAKNTGAVTAVDGGDTYIGGVAGCSVGTIEDSVNTGAILL